MPLKSVVVACLPALMVAGALSAQSVGTGAQPSDDPASETAPTFAGPDANDPTRIPPDVNVVTEEDAPFAAAGALASRLDPQTLFESEVFSIVPAAMISTPLLQDARVIDISGERLSGIDGVVMAEDGFTITGIVLPVGGIAGIGRKLVEIPLGATLVGHSEELNETRIVLAFTEAELADLPAFEPTAAQ